MRKISKKRSQQLKEYKKITSNIEERKKQGEKFVCIFCGDIVQQAYEKHHLMGREEKLLNNEDYLFVVHPMCHFKYHNHPIKYIWWWDGYLGRIKNIDDKFYHRESMKKQK
jgi:hypothetical protein